MNRGGFFVRHCEGRSNFIQHFKHNVTLSEVEGFPAQKGFDFAQPDKQAL